MVKIYPANEISNIHITLKSNKNGQINDVLFVDDIRYNLLLVPKFDDAHCFVFFRKWRSQDY